LWDTASVFLCVSESIRKKAAEAGFPSDKLRIQYNGIQPDPITRGDSERDNNLILFVGRLVEKKGCAYLLRAMKTVKESCPNVRLVMIGEGPLRPTLVADAAAHDLPCTFLGAQPSDVVRRYQKQAAVACVPSVTAENGDSEGLPTVILEALTAGATVVASAHAGATEAIVDGETGLVVPERNADELAAALIRALQNPELRFYMREKGRNLVRDRFDVRKLAKNLEFVYDEVSLRRLPKEQALVATSVVG